MRRVLAALLSLAFGASATFAQVPPADQEESGWTVQQRRQAEQKLERLTRDLEIEHGAIDRLLVECGLSHGLSFRAYLEQIDVCASEIRRYRDEIAMHRSGETSDMRGLRRETDRAVREGRLGDARQSWGRYIELSEARVRDRRTSEDRLLAQNRAIAAHLAIASGDYRGGADHYAVAASITPDATEQWRYTFFRAQTLARRGVIFGANEDLRESVYVYRDQALALAPRERMPFEWGQTQVGLATALTVLGERGDAQALDAGIAVLDEVLEATGGTEDGRNWAGAQQGLCHALLRRGEVSGREDLDAAVRACTAALTVLDQQRFRIEWAHTKIGLGATYYALAERFGDDAGAGAEAELRDALGVLDREGDFEPWARAQNNLGLVLLRRGMREEGDALAQSVAAFDAALLVFDRDDNPAQWALAQMNRGIALLRLAERGERSFAESVAAFENALQVFTLQSDARNWVRAKHGLAAALLRIGAQGDASAFDRAAAVLEETLPIVEADTEAWANAQLNLGVTRETQGNFTVNLDDARALYDRAIDHYRAAHDVYVARGLSAPAALVVSNLANAHNSRCVVRTYPDADLSLALADCNEAMRLRPGDPNILDSRGLVQLLRGRCRLAVRDYDAALFVNPRLADSLFARGICRRRLGERRAGRDDIQSALAIDAEVAARLREHGVRP